MISVESYQHLKRAKRNGDVLTRYPTELAFSKTYADGASVAYTHTPDGLPQRTTWARGVWRESAYDAARREIGRHYSDPSLDCAFERDVFGALSSASNAVAQTAFLRDNPGMPTNETHAIAGDSFAIRRAYDANGRLALLEWAADGDAASRRVAFAYDGEGRLSTVSNESFSASYAYHAHGHELGYTLTLSSGAKVVRSVSRLTRPPNTVTAVTNFFVSASGETNALPSFAYALDDLLRPVARNVAVVDESGTFVAAYEYDPFGNVVSSSGAEADAVPFRFSTKYFDSETGLYYYGYRFYTPELGRWINRDPIEEEGGENLYAFCRNDSISQIDELGKNIYLVEGNDTGYELNDRYHQSICVDDEKSLDRFNGKTCFSFGLVGVGCYFPKRTWLGWYETTLGGLLMKGEVYETTFIGRVLKTKATTKAQDAHWLAWMRSARKGLTDVYSVARHNCRRYSQNEFHDAPGVILP